MDVESREQIVGDAGDIVALGRPVAGFRCCHGYVISILFSNEQALKELMRICAEKIASASNAPYIR